MQRERSTIQVGREIEKISSSQRKKKERNIQVKYIKSQDFVHRKRKKNEQFCCFNQRLGQERKKEEVPI